jgi:hypothetical protein
VDRWLGVGVGIWEFGWDWDRDFTWGEVGGYEEIYMIKNISAFIEPKVMPLHQNFSCCKAKLQVQVYWASPQLYFQNTNNWVGEYLRL